jgi:hypothetical protein
MKKILSNFWETILASFLVGIPIAFALGLASLR